MAESELIPQYRKLAELLRKHIENGVYGQGDLLPSENELCSLHGLTRPTVRHALDTLVKDGYIKKHKGKGSIVQPVPQEIGILSIQGTTSAIGKENLRTLIVEKPALSHWQEPFLFELSPEEKESGCIRMERLRLVKKQPIFYDINFIPNINLPRFTRRNFENKSLFEILRQHYQVEIRAGEQRLRAIPATEQLSRYFGIEKGQPVLHLERKMDTNRVGFHIYSSIFCNTEKYWLYGTF